MRHVLSHQSGAIGVPGADDLLSWDGTGWDDPAAIAAAIAGGPPSWEPGTRHGYHGLTFGWLIGELVRRVSGVSLGTFLRTEVAQPLGAECRLGTPADRLANVARVMEWTPRASSKPASVAPRSTPTRRPAGPSSPVRGAASSPTSTARPASRTFMNTPAVLDGRDRRDRRDGHRARARAASTRRWPRARSSSHARPSRASPRSRCAAAMPSCGSRPGGRWATRASLPRSCPACRASTVRTTRRSGTWARAARSGSRIPITGVGCAFVRNHLEHQALPLMGATVVDTFSRCLASDPNRHDD